MKNRNAKANGKEKSPASIKPSKSALRAASKAKASFTNKMNAGKAKAFTARQPLSQASADSVKAELVAQEAKELKERQRAIIHAKDEARAREARKQKEAEKQARLHAKEAKAKAKAEAKAEKARKLKEHNAATRVAQNRANYDSALVICRNGNLASACANSLRDYGTLIQLPEDKEYYSLFRISRGGFTLPPLRQTYDKLAELLSLEKESSGKKTSYSETSKKLIAKSYNMVRSAHESFIRAVKDDKKAKNTLRGRQTAKAGISFRSVTSVGIDKKKLEEKKATAIFSAMMTASDALLLHNASAIVSSFVWMADDKKGTVGQFSLWRRLRTEDSKLPAYISTWDKEDVDLMLNLNTPAKVGFDMLKLAAVEKLEAVRASKANA